MNNRIRFLAALLILALLPALFSGCGKDGDAEPVYAQRGEVERAPMGELKPAADAEALLAALAAAEEQQAARWEPEAPEEAENGPLLRLCADGTGDTVVTDGAYIYMLDRYGLVTVSAAGAQSQVLSYTKVEREGETWGERLYLWQDRLAVLWMDSAEPAEEAPWQSATETAVTLYDLKDPAAPEKLASVSVEGSLLDAFLLEGTLCTVTQKRFLSLPEPAKAEELLPKLREQGESLALRAGEVYLSPEPSKAAITVTALLRLEDGRFQDALAFTDGAEAVRLWGNRLYLARTRWKETVSEPRQEEVYTVVEHQISAVTEIKRLSCDGGLTLEAGCVLQGALSDPEALAVVDDRVRVLTELDQRSYRSYTDEKHGWTNYEGSCSQTGSQLVLLDDALEPLCSLTDLGGEKGIGACRFLNATAWIAAEDSLSLAELSATPQIRAAFPAEGRELLLQDLGGDTVMSLALPAAGEKLKLTMYGLTDPSQPKRLDSLELEAVPAGDLTARGALFADSGNGLLGWPAQRDGETEYRLIRWDGSEFQDLGALPLSYVPADARGLLLEGLLYICSPGVVYVTDPETMTVLTSVSNAVG